MLPSSDDLHYFVEVANKQNISRAAERLGISQPALTLAIQRLETTVGTPLLIRSKTGVQLTRSGQKLSQQVRFMISEWEKIRNETLRDEVEISGRYIIGCHCSVGLYTLHHILPTLMQKHPSLEIKLLHDLSRRIAEDIISFKIDFGIVVNPPPHPDLVIKLLFTDEVTLWTNGKKSPLQEPFSGEGVLICDPDLLQTQALLKQMTKVGMHFRRTITSSNLEIITSLTSSGTGIGILPQRVATRFQLGLKPIGKNTPKFSDRICLIYRADAQKSKSARHIASLIYDGLKSKGE